MPLSWIAIGAGNMELFYVQWNVSMETGLVTVTDKLIKPLSNRNSNQSLNQQLSPAVTSASNHPGNRFTWNCFVGTGKLRCAAFYKAWRISEKIVFASLTGNSTLRMGSYNFCFCVGLNLNFLEMEIKIKRSYLIQVTWLSYFTIKIQANFVFHQSIYFFNWFYSLGSSLTDWNWD